MATRPTRRARSRPRIAVDALRPAGHAGRAERERRIREIVEQHPVRTQEELAAALGRRGYTVTQATVSRDIKRLGLVKARAGREGMRYVLPEQRSPVDVLRRLRYAATEYVLSVDAGEDLVVIHTLTGCANAVAEAIDEMRWPDVVGTVAGDNTILVVPRRRAAREHLLNRLRQLADGTPESA
jgi:transcriptional regulator of arginine metabolism